MLWFCIQAGYKIWKEWALWPSDSWKNGPQEIRISPVISSWNEALMKPWGKSREGTYLLEKDLLVRGVCRRDLELKRWWLGPWLTWLLSLNMSLAFYSNATLKTDLRQGDCHQISLSPFPIWPHWTISFLLFTINFKLLIGLFRMGGQPGLLVHKMWSLSLITV